MLRPLPSCLVGLCLALAMAAAPALAMVFTEVSEPAGVTYTQHVLVPEPGCFFQSLCGVERMTGGAAVGDVEGDGDLDLYVTRLDAHDLLFLNQGNGQFVDGTQQAGLAGFDLQSNGAAFADIDNDGDLDLLVVTVADSFDTTNGRNFLFVNDGTGVFQEEAVARGFDDTATTPRAVQSVGVGDYDGDGYLDVHVGDWLLGPHSRLFRNLGEASPGHFEDVTASAGVDENGVYGFASSFVDLDVDGHADLVVAADFGTSRIYWNDGQGGFTDGTVAAGVGTDENGMGSAFGDVDGDGDLDWFVTSIEDPDDTCAVQGCNWGNTGNRLFRNEGARSFSDATDAVGVREGFWGWGASFLDGDLDGDLDLVMTNGVDFPGTNVDAAWVADPMRLWENDGTGAMTEVSGPAGVTDTASGKGLLVFDYDEDGDQDLFVVNNGGTPRLYRNDTPREGRSYLRVQTYGPPGIAATGARVRVWTHDLDEEPQLRVVGASSHFLGEGERIQHFGLGAGVDIVRRVEVLFPDGQVSMANFVPANQRILIRRPIRCGLVGLELLPVLAWVRLRRQAGRRR